MFLFHRVHLSMIPMQKVHGPALGDHQADALTPACVCAGLQLPRFWSLPHWQNQQLRKGELSRLKIAFQYILVCSSPFSAFLCVSFCSQASFLSWMDHSGTNMFSTGSQRCTLNTFSLKTRSLTSAILKTLPPLIPISKTVPLNLPSFITQVRTRTGGIVRGRANLV